jgi:quinol monooxygenase YgiN
MTFQADKIEAFLEIFNHSKEKIRNSPGCSHLELLQDADQPHIFCTYSYWEDEQALENYRHSQLFTTTWAQTKVLFAGKPQAFSLHSLLKVEGA